MRYGNLQERGFPQRDKIRFATLTRCSRKKIRLRQPAANGDGRLIRLTRYHSIFVNLIHTLIGYGFFINTIIEPYILPAVTVGLRLRLLSDFLKIRHRISDSRSEVSSHSLVRCFTPASSSLNSKGIVLLLVLAFI